MPDQEAKLDATIRAFSEQAARAGELKDKLAELRGSARNADGSVTVTVAPSGALLGLQLSPRAVQRSHTQLQQEILATVRQATQQAAALMEETVRPVLGDRLDQFKEAFSAHAVEPIGPATPPAAENLPGPVHAPAPKPTPRPARRRDDSDDEDFGGPIMRPTH
ncbi:YbaB/EbfC family nucleoid-associated protein [Amycolatopsis suaedae]|uniref:YbaB/EbfC family DNA-binding protein n=1 Tax=Amycolatopsis suaedae TaxID=2510978 RepID=A0A4Q7J4R2_9PSEU|nr:YbaB/EbfC family nucleoid-associated protein [Amycolatopsis suaedae]RZQ62039.1 YbaB/EbfC family DNA-binding protein [Amycolatopsis suaedae]